MLVGPSAAPMMPMLAASLREKPQRGGDDHRGEDAELGGRAEEDHEGIFEQRPEVEIIAPTAMKMRRGKSSVWMPML